MVGLKMKLNKDLIRDIAIYIESNGDGERPKTEIEIDGYTYNEIRYHFMQMLDMGLIKVNIRSINGSVLKYYSLTYKGHEFLENIRDKYIWDEIKREIELRDIKDFINSYIKSKFNF